MSDYPSFHRELHSGTLRRDGSGVFDAFLGKRLDHAPGNHVIDDTVLLGKKKWLFTRDEQGVVVSHFTAVHAAACRFSFQPHLAFRFGHITDKGEQPGDFGEHVFGNIAASGTRIGNEFLLVESLCDFKRLFCREAVFYVGFLLQGGQVVQERSLFRPLLPFYAGNGD